MNPDLADAHQAASKQSTLDNLTLSRKEGWNRFVDALDRAKPDDLTMRELADLSDPARIDHNRRRRKWHANLGPIRTPQLAQLHEDLWDILDSNDQDGDKPKGAIAIDAFPGLGKTTSALAFAKRFQQREIGEEGQYTSLGHERLPVCRVGLTANTGMKDFNRAMLEFFGHPATGSGTTTQFASRALDCVLSCEVKIILIDDLHFLRFRGRHNSGVDISNHFKYIANEFPVTLLLIGVSLTRRGLFTDELSDEDTVLAQTARRTTRLTMAPFTIDDDRSREHWQQMLLAVESRLVLAAKRPGMITDCLSDYLFARSTGHIGSLMTLVNRGCQRAVRTGSECLTADPLDHVKNDEGAEKARLELMRALREGRKASKPRKRQQKKPP